MALPVFFWWQIKTIKDTGVVIHTKKGDGFAYLGVIQFFLTKDFDRDVSFLFGDGSILYWMVFFIFDFS